MMDPVLVVLISIYLIQFPVAIYINFDMRKFNLNEFQRYDLAILVPLGGLLILPYYVYRRREFEKNNDKDHLLRDSNKSDIFSTKTKLFVLALLTGIPFRAAGSQSPGSASQLILLTISGISGLLLFRAVRQYQRK